MTAHAHNEAAYPTVPVHVVLRPPRVLVVHSDPTYRTQLGDALLRIGCHPVEATCAEEGLTWLDTDRIELALVTQRLPGMSGAEMIGLVRSSKDETLHDLPVIGLSSDEQSESELARAGVGCFVHHPFEEAELLRAVRWVAERFWAHGVEEATETPPSR